MKNITKKMFLVLLGSAFAFANTAPTATSKKTTDKFNEKAPNHNYGAQTGVPADATIQEPGSRVPEKQARKGMRDNVTPKADTQDETSPRSE